MSHIIASFNCEWPGFSDSAPWGDHNHRDRGERFADAMKGANATLFVAQELGWNRAHTFSYNLDLVQHLGKTWTHHRADANGLGLNCAGWNKDEWEQDGDHIDRNIRSYGQQARTVILVPLVNKRTGEKVTIGASHFANRAAKDLSVSPVVAQRGQALDVNSACGTRRRVILGIDSNSPTKNYGGRAELERRGWKTRASGLDIIATREGIDLTRFRTVPIPSDHPKGIISSFTTNTGTDA